jgi:putative ABC transport system permease protein
MNLLENLWQDTRYAGRALRRSPGFAATAILALGLGIGANTAIFSVVNAVLLQPLPYPQPDRLVRLDRSFPNGDNSGGASIPNFIVWREQRRVFEAIAAYDFAGPGVNLTGGENPEQVKAIHASADYFAVFRAPIIMGRAFNQAEDGPGGPHVVVISYGLWRGRFGGDTSIIGKTISLGDDPYEVVGVLGANFTSDPRADVWIPLQADPNSTDQAHYLLAAARLRPGVTLGQAQAGMKLAAAQFKRKFAGSPLIDPHESATARPLRDTIVSGVRPALLILLGAVGFVLLIACANVANLLLARATLRRREIAIRAALGAGRRRIMSQLLTESVMLSLAGGALGLVLGYSGVRGLLAINPGNIPRIGENGSGVSLDWRVFVFTFVIAVVTGILFGLIPALTASRTDLNATLKESSSRSGSGFRQNKARSILVVTETALALILLVGAALLIRTFAALRSVNSGFDSHNVLTLQMSLTGTRFAKTAGVAEAVRAAEQRVGAIPGVTAIAAACCLPLEIGPDLPFTIDGHAPKDSPFNGDDQWRNVSSDYFAAFRIPLLRGRLFNHRDTAGSDPVVIIDEAMAKKYWPKGNAIGSSITIGRGLPVADRSRQVVGIVADIRDQSLDTDPNPMMYIPLAQVPDGVTVFLNRVIPLTWVIRTKVAPFSLNAEIQRELRTATGGLPVAHVRSMEQVVAQSTARTDFNTMLLSIFAGVALLLAAIGIYGLMTYSVQQRTQEIGIRMALGASPENVQRMVVAQGMRLALVGVVIGAAAALALTRLMAGLIYGVKTWDPVVFVSVAIILSAVSWFATYVPARRASHVDPTVSLRYE